MKMDVLHRTLHPSGHGAFFTERIRQDGKDDVIVVYDCGAKDVEERELLKKEVDEFFDSNDKIDILFISHFDSDHVNGIEFLKPYISDKTKLVMPFSYEYFYLVKDTPVLQYMSMVMGVVADLSVKQYWVKYADISRLESSDGQSLMVDGQDINAGFLDSGTRMGYAASSKDPKKYKWIYVPFNLYDDRYYREKFEGEVRAKLGKDPQVIKPSELDKEAIEKLREIYKSLGPYKTKDVKDSTKKSNGSKNINFNSLILLSKATRYDCYCHPRIPLIRMRCRNCDMYGLCDGSCLYTGDSNLKRSDCVNRLRTILGYYTQLPICLFQLPHHGSRNNYCEWLLRDYDLYCNLFVNCGEYDFKQKSFPKLFTDVKEANRNLIMVTGKKLCRLEQEVVF